MFDTKSEAKHCVEDGEVIVNNQVEFRKRCKLRIGDTVEFAGERIIIEQ